MSTTLSGPVETRPPARRVWKDVKRFLIPAVVLVPFAYFFPKIALFYVVCGIYDVGRNRALKPWKVQRYFIGNGFLLWFLSPINILLDLFCLPYVNKGVYRLEDLPPGHQEEIRRVIRIAAESDLVGRVDEMARQHKRAMVSWRSYGANVDAVVDVPGFDGPWTYVQTIALSIFNKRIATSSHFGWLRPTLRVLYNINDMKDKSSHIVVGDKINYWCEEKLFIFDDTLLHRSLNETDELRYCMFLDILRPSPFPWVMAAVVAAERFINTSLSFTTYSGWTLIKRRAASTDAR